MLKSERLGFIFLAGVLSLLTSISMAQTTPQGTSSASPAANASENKAGRVLLDRNLEPANQDEISALFENVVAVQRKAKVKAGKFLFSPMLSFDFSDSVYTMYGFNLNFGYALGEFWEIYLNYVPTFVTNERSIAKKVRELPLLSTGDRAVIYAEKAKSAFGIEINWVPIYGKDSWGPYGIIRSDTFVNFALSQTKYELNSGMKYKLALGKTFFLSPLWNMRVQAGAAYLDAFSSGESSTPKKESIVIGLIEAGMVFYF